jgi:hypothetical protein
MKKYDLAVIKATGEIVSFIGYEDGDMQGAVCVSPSNVFNDFKFYIASAIEPFVPSILVPDDWPNGEDE